jgi:DNA-binding transcriptional LysR family regulator
MDLRQLQYFATLADELHFRRAAERMHITQPAFSQKIRRLETELRVRLFERGPHYVRLTEAGRLFLQEVEPALAQLEHAAATAGRVASGVLGTLKLGVAATTLDELIPVILREFAARCTSVGIELHEYGFGDPSAGLMAREVEVALLWLPMPAHAELDLLPLLDEPRVAVVPADHSLATAAVLSAEDLAGEPLVSGPHPAGWRHRQTARPLANSLDGWLSLIAAGRGVGIAPASAERLHAHPGVRFIPLAGVAPSTLAIAYRRHGTPPPVREFVRIAGKVVERLGHSRHAQRGTPAIAADGAERGDRIPLSDETDLGLVAASSMAQAWTSRGSRGGASRGN